MEVTFARAYNLNKILRGMFLWLFQKKRKKATDSLGTWVKKKPWITIINIFIDEE